MNKKEISIQWKPLNVITLEQNIFDHNNQMITLTEHTLWAVDYKKLSFTIDHIKQMLTLTVITLSGFYCRMFYLEKTQMLIAFVMRAKIPQNVIATPSTQQPHASICRNSLAPNWPQLVDVWLSTTTAVALSNILSVLLKVSVFQ